MWIALPAQAVFILEQDPGKESIPFLQMSTAQSALIHQLSHRGHQMAQETATWLPATVL